MFSAERLELARKRCRYTAKSLAEAAKISPVTLSRIVNRKQEPDEATVVALAGALNYPVAFFFKDEPPKIRTEAVSFRSLSTMTARERDAALAAGELAFELMDWVKDRFTLPEPDLLYMGPKHEQDPAATARMVRQHWAIGEKPIGGIIRLLESKGVRVFSLSEETKNVDAFSCWRGDEPFIFLNTKKSTEHSRFDAAHELGHLVLHKHGGPRGREAETEANNFASAFLMPHADLASRIPFVSSARQIISAKKRWGVSAVALAYRLNKLGKMTEWQYIQINRQYRTNEPEPMPPEHSAVWKMVLSELWREKISRAHIARDLSLPADEVTNLLFGLVEESPPPQRSAPDLRII